MIRAGRSLGIPGERLAEGRKSFAARTQCATNAATHSYGTLSLTLRPPLGLRSEIGVGRFVFIRPPAPTTENALPGVAAGSRGGARGRRA